jgi:hypothetical protein
MSLSDMKISLSFLYYRFSIATKNYDLCLIPLKYDNLEILNNDVYKYLIKLYIYNIKSFNDIIINDLFFIGKRNKLFIKYFIKKLYQTNLQSDFLELFIDQIFL